LRLPPAVLFLLAVAAQRRCRRHHVAPPVRTAAVTLAGAGVAILAASGLSFRRHGTTIDPVHPAAASALVTTGVNARTRNPMYLALAAGLFAHALARGSWAALVPSAGFIAAIDRWQIPVEEAALRQRFGTDFVRYCTRVPRWIGPRSFGLGTSVSPGQ
jgi:protein-S-isoprenylcysteine O-methyltransferase Ste14